MDHSIIEENNIVVRYLQGQLDADEAERFEEHYFDCAECLESLELTKRLNAGLKGAVAEEEMQLTQTLALTWLARRGRRLQAFLALALFGLMILPWMILTPRISDLSENLRSVTAPQTEILTLSLSTERSGGVAQEPSSQIVLGPNPEWIELALQVPPYSEASSYRVELLHQDNRSLWESGPSEADAQGKIHLHLHSTWLESADYRVELQALIHEGSWEPAGRFSFRVRDEL